MEEKQSVEHQTQKIEQEAGACLDRIEEVVNTSDRHAAELRDLLQEYVHKILALKELKDARAEVE